MSAVALKSSISVPQMQELQSFLVKHGGEANIPACQLTGHKFCKGLYSRQFFLPKGVMAVSLMHKEENFFLVVQGECSIWGDEGNMRVRAPFMTVTKPGTKRVVYGHEDTIFVTFHPNPDNVTDLQVLEQTFVIPEQGVLRDETANKLPHEVTP